MKKYQSISNLHEKKERIKKEKYKNKKWATGDKKNKKQSKKTNEKNQTCNKTMIRQRGEKKENKKQ